MTNEPKASDQWISVEERLPEIQTRVLITDGKQVDSGWLMSSIGWIRPRRIENVTHWQPLPSPPGRE